MQQFQTNVFGVLNVTNAALPHMRERQSGTVVIVGSRTGWHAACPVSILPSILAQRMKLIDILSLQPVGEK